jgi:diaminopimelate epimerase
MRFTKMQGIGNDYIYVDCVRDRPPADPAALARVISDRHFGVGADGLILICPSERGDARMRMFNADGSEAEMCGNGVRCFVKYLLDRGLVDALDGMVRVETMTGVLEARATRDAEGCVETVRVGMGAPRLGPQDVGVVATAPKGSFLSMARAMESPLTATGKGLTLTLVSMGNPHAVHFLDSPVADFDLECIGPAVEHDPLFANRTNFEVVRVRDRSHLDMRVWERGAGATLACGTGACAAVVAARLQGRVDDDVEVGVPGGTLQISWDGAGEVYLEGPAALVFESVWEEATA